MDFSSYGMITIALTLLGMCNAYLDDNVEKPIFSAIRTPEFDRLQNNITQLIDKIAPLRKQHRPLYERDEEEQMIGNENNCYAHSKIFKPFMVTVNNTQYHVAQDKTFEQRIRVSECADLDEPCFTSVFGVRNTVIKAVCKQKYSIVSLYLYDPNTNKIGYKPVRIPVACYCELTRREP